MGTSQSAVARLEAGRSDARVSTLERYATALGTSLAVRSRGQRMTVSTWPGGPEWPERPGYPYPPARPMPRREGPLMVPVVDVPGGDAADELRSRRRVLLTGRLDAAGATRSCAPS